MSAGSATPQPDGGPNAGAPAMWCDRCGRPIPDGGHEPCTAARRLEPPRYCGQCRRRMKVQVMPTGWRATCVEHGTRSSS